jgi:hypothetical protein
MQKVGEAQDSVIGELLSLTGVQLPPVQSNLPPYPLARHQLVEVHETVVSWETGDPCASNFHTLPFQSVTRSS